MIPIHTEPPTIGQKRVRVAVIGAGHWGANLIRTFAELGCLAAVYDQSHEAASRQAAKFGVTAAGSWDDKALWEDVQALVIATPAETHFELAKKALLAGRDVLVEKPMTLKAVESEDLIDLADRQGAILMVGHLLKYHPAVTRLKTLVTEGALGPVEYIYSNRLNLGKVRREENALWSFAPHDISVVQHILGDAMPIQVSASGGAYLQPNIADVTLSNLLFQGGTRAHIFVSWLHPYKEQRLVVIGRDAMAVFDDVAAEHKLKIFTKDINLRNGEFVAGKPHGTPVEFPLDEPLKIECRHFLDCIETRTTPLTDGQDGLRVIRVLEACQRSLDLNGEPIQVPSDVRHAVVRA